MKVLKSRDMYLSQHTNTEDRILFTPLLYQALRFDSDNPAYSHLGSYVNLDKEVEKVFAPLKPNTKLYRVSTDPHYDNQYVFWEASSWAQTVCKVNVLGPDDKPLYGPLKGRRGHKFCVEVANPDGSLDYYYPKQ